MDDPVVGHPGDEAEAREAEHQARLPYREGDPDDAGPDDGVDVVARGLGRFKERIATLEHYSKYRII